MSKYSEKRESRTREAPPPETEADPVQRAVERETRRDEYTRLTRRPDQIHLLLARESLRRALEAAKDDEEVANRQRSAIRYMFRLVKNPVGLDEREEALDLAKEALKEMLRDVSDLVEAPL